MEYLKRLLPSKDIPSPKELTHEEQKWIQQTPGGWYRVGPRLPTLISNTFGVNMDYDHLDHIITVHLNTSNLDDFIEGVPADMYFIKPYSQQLMERSNPITSLKQSQDNFPNVVKNLHSGRYIDSIETNMRQNPVQIIKEAKDRPMTQRLALKPIKEAEILKDETRYGHFMQAIEPRVRYLNFNKLKQLEAQGETALYSGVAKAYIEYWQALFEQLAHIESLNKTETHTLLSAAVDKGFRANLRTRREHTELMMIDEYYTGVQRSIDVLFPQKAV